MKKLLTVLTLVLILVLGSFAAAWAGAASSDTPVRITGTIIDASMNTITIESGSGTQLAFMTADADKSGCNGLIIGSSVDIFYTGTITGSDTSGAQVVMMEQPNADPEPTPEPMEEPEPTEEPAEDEDEDYDEEEDTAKDYEDYDAPTRITGEIQNATLTIEAENGEIIEFDISGADLALCSSLIPGDVADVFFTGKVVGDDASEATVTAIETPYTTNLATGIILDATMNTITIQTADGVELFFGTEGANTSECEGLTIGSYVRIYYTGAISGTDTSGATVLSMEQS